MISVFDASSFRRIRNRFVNSETSLAERFRRRRWDQIMSEFPDLSEMSVLDLGGTTQFWTRAPIRPKLVTVINLDENLPLPWLQPIKGDALKAPELVGAQTFDLVFSNSLIEHLGGHFQRERFANIVRSIAPRYAVQTPYRYFPIEPHWLCPGMQFMPVKVQDWLAVHWPLGQTRGWPEEQAYNEVRFTELISLTEMRSHFPDARIELEKFAGLTKSMTAFR
jgi:hypothetical protein